MMYKITNEKVAILKDRMIRDWNALPPGVVTVPSVKAFKASLTKLN
jgi:hypothetical protein